MQIEVSFEIDTNGILQVSAIDAETGRAQNARVQIIGTSSDEAVDQMAERQDQMPAPVDHAVDDEEVTGVHAT